MLKLKLNSKNVLKKWILKLCFNINYSNCSYTNVILHFVYHGWTTNKLYSPLLNLQEWLRLYLPGQIPNPSPGGVVRLGID